MTAMDGRDFREPDDPGSSASEAVAARRLCVVSGHPLQSGVFIAGLTTSVGSRDELEIIVDRRRRSSGIDTPSVERRHRPSIVRALEQDGFAIVPMSSSPGAERLTARLVHRETALPTEHAESEGAYKHQLERLLRFQHRRIVRSSRWFIFSVLVNAILFLMLVTPVIRSVVRPARSIAPSSSIDAPASRVADSPSSPAATR